MGHDQRIRKSILEFLEKQGKWSPSNIPLWRKVLEAQAKKRCLESWNQRVHNVRTIKKSKLLIRSRRPRNLIMKRRRTTTMTRSPLDGSRRSTTAGVENKVRTLKKLIPNGESMEGLDGLFRETADYILALQMRVNLMQIMVKALSGEDHE